MIIRTLAEIACADASLVGGKAASLGEMVQRLAAVGVDVPRGFVVTTEAYRDFLAVHNLGHDISVMLKDITDMSDVDQVRRVSQDIRNRITAEQLPAHVRHELARAYEELGARYGERTIAVAVRSSAVAEDRPEASFAGQQESFLNVHGIVALERAVVACIASLFTERALIYRATMNIPADMVALAVCIQKMVDTRQGSSGVLFTLDPDTGFRQVVSINALYGLGELLVQGQVIPDEYLVYKETLRGEPRAIVRKRKGLLHEALQAAPYTAEHAGGLERVALDERRRASFVLSDDRIRDLAELGVRIERHYGMPMDIEWAYDGTADKLYIVQARPETIHGRKGSSAPVARRYLYEHTPDVRAMVATGAAIGSGIAHGIARHIGSLNDSSRFNIGDVLVVNMTDPDWLPLMRRASAIVTNVGGRTCHAAIVSRELGIPAVIGTKNGTESIVDGSPITVDASRGLQGYVYRGHLPFVVKDIALHGKTPYDATLLMNIAQPEQAFLHAALPVAGVGLARLEFIMTNNIGIHPLAALYPERLLTQEQPGINGAQVYAEIMSRAQAYGTPRDFFVARLSEGIASLAAAFYPRPVIVRLSDFKTNEYRNLLGGAWFEHVEENPMLGWRGASRYVHPDYTAAFLLECEALRVVREAMGFINVHCMIPFVRTVEEACAVDGLLNRERLVRSAAFLRYMMVELPVNVLLLEQFAPFFDGFSIGSNDLTQLTLGVDRDSSLLSNVFDERNDAVKQLIAMAIVKAHGLTKPIGICGEAPSTYPDYARWLVGQGIDSLSLSPDAILSLLSEATP